MTEPTELPAHDRVRVRVNGMIVDGWTGCAIRRELETVASSADLAVPHDSLGRLPLDPWDAVEVLAGDDLMLTGWVTGLDAAIKPQERGGSLTIRSRTCDLVDCAAPPKPGQWSGAGALRVARDIAAPFDIGVQGPGDADPLGAFELEQGEGAFAAIDRAARFCALLARDDAAGDLVLFRPMQRAASVSLVQDLGADGRPLPGNNVLEVAAKIDTTGRFSETTVKTQSGGDDSTAGAVAFAASGSALDPGVPRHRPRIVQGENAGTAADCARRAKWEVSRALGKALEVTVSVPGWRQTPGGPLWDVDLLVPFRSNVLGIDRALLVTSVKWSLDPSGGLTTQLKLQPPEAWTPEPAPPGGASGDGGAKLGALAADVADG